MTFRPGARLFLALAFFGPFPEVSVFCKDASRSLEVSVDFDAHPSGAYEMRVFRRDWANASLGRFHRRATIVDEPKGKSLRMSYPRGSLGPGQGGGQFRERLVPAKAYRLSYGIFFEKGFDFRKGGKLPGLGGGRGNTGGERTTGDGWSARYMWGEGGQLALYLYHLDQKTKYGDHYGLGVKVVPGRWHSVEQVVEVNSPGKPDGRIRVRVDKSLVLDLRNLRLRGKVKPEVALVDQFLFSTFHGGSGKDWAPIRDSHARFDDFLIRPVRRDLEKGE